ncbi:Concanavalin A-like lectin/glucanase, subgroup [Penicillium expansum]|uniref:Concanavalin A-like lectin/glucanase, subgroup n=1 Tax=Penicillium expansum TaxID=27334 RepID=A0A0A2KYX1_PENEN|nr:Concanavalin A-like lectin/glucanase, subgroup [Penicillium expansum]KGO45351.1 Concanavalin A-like lectin/glucanase, subgroup [Penicillium expansum]KGO63167.1 Concanavalin A-like lectin/glucanase, subgroup [Penicillium expansum]KGO72096.1 Concanavalin A-like lectin/glucanase, subgroup [Penicillium expansum]
MMRTLASLALIAVGATAQLIESSSFGAGQTISPNRHSIPGWAIGGEGHEPQILSDKLILTPPYPGNTRGSAWAQTPVSQSEWSAEFQFRASGPERAGGILQLWYTKDGQSRIGTSSIYTVGQFDGFALVIDTHGGRGGSVRGFLNDGTIDYKSHNSPDTLAFGHCDYSYRNLGRPSIVKLKHTSSIFEVTLDDKLCFSTNKVALPAGNTFGITAATPENPDSFEVFKFILESAASQGSTIPSNQGSTPQQPIRNQVPDQPAQPIKPGTEVTMNGLAAQIADLSGRIQLSGKATNIILQELKNQALKADQRHEEIIQKSLAQDRQLAQFDTRLAHLEQLIQVVQTDVQNKDYSGRFNQLHETLRSSHLSLSENLQGHLLSVITASSPRMGFFIFLLIAFQVVLVISYVIYKRRRANMPKKFL